jgi:hypothetical protein
MSWSTRSRPAKSRSALRTSRGTAMELSLFFWGCETKYKLGTCNPFIKKRNKNKNIKKYKKKGEKKIKENIQRERERAKDKRAKRDVSYI